MSVTALRKIGKDSVPAIGFGAMGISVAYGKVGTDEERFKVLDAAFEAGCTHWDTADVYGDSEDLIGKWFKRNGKRSSIFLATKFGLSFADGRIRARGDPEYIKQQFNNSLERLGTDYIDLYYVHRVDPLTPIETSIQVMADFVKDGKVKYLGMSECTANDLRRAHAVHPITALEVEYSPFALEIEDPKLALLKTARELNIKIIAYSPLGRGLLTGEIKSPDDFEPDDARHTFTKFSKENFPKILSIVDRIQEIGKKHSASAGQVVLSWILAQGEDFFVIPGTKKEKYLLENVGAAAVKLSQEEIDTIRKIAEEADQLPGDRFQPGWRDIAYTESPQLPE
ncbi:hypothetical protein GYMLUDRAFT_97303 [Collybiopsis luxurians FD-317 M1]|uniref:NADP-dependent oxidoreductase domain-containing protein n=1 Tax=Collybiopsis luxurians FD-317 M1 TaxID=944289 RepID=A0A0D0CCN2_9AGAR|nr:hypothetical protein GYMLUDRAFT_97303 [Collybiopsis luxurians FD-317 M1]